MCKKLWRVVCSIICNWRVRCEIYHSLNLLWLLWLQRLWRLQQLLLCRGQVLHPLSPTSWRHFLKMQNVQAKQSAIGKFTKASPKSDKKVKKQSLLQEVRSKNPETEVRGQKSPEVKSPRRGKFRRDRSRPASRGLKQFKTLTGLYSERAATANLFKPKNKVRTEKSVPKQVGQKKKLRWFQSWTRKARFPVRCVEGRLLDSGGKDSIRYRKGLYSRSCLLLLWILWQSDVTPMGISWQAWYRDCAYLLILCYDLSEAIFGPLQLALTPAQWQSVIVLSIQIAFIWYHWISGGWSIYLDQSGPLRAERSKGPPLKMDIFVC